jgi:DNA-binding transcriptional MerR regulator
MIIKHKGNLEYYMNISQAAAELGVSASTLRNWDRSGKLVAARHPLNKYRLYNQQDIESVLQEIRRSK